MDTLCGQIAGCFLLNLEVGVPTISPRALKIICMCFRRVRKIEKRDCCLRRVWPSVRMEQLDSNWTDFHEIWYLSIFRESVEKIQVSLKSDKNIGYFT